MSSSIEVPESLPATITAEDAENSLRALAHHHATVEKLLAWSRDQIASVQAKVEFHESIVRAFARSMREATGRSTMELPGGTLRARKARSRVVREEAPLLEWLRAGNMVADERFWSEKPRWGEIMSDIEISDSGEAVHTPTGQVLPDNLLRVEAPAAPISVSIALKGEEK